MESVSYVGGLRMEQPGAYLELTLCSRGLGKGTRGTCRWKTDTLFLNHPGSMVGVEVRSHELVRRYLWWANAGFLFTRYGSRCT